MEELQKRVEQLEKENAELKRQLEERQMCLCIPLDKIHFNDPYLEMHKNQISIKNTKEGLRYLENAINLIEIR